MALPRHRRRQASVPTRPITRPGPAGEPSGPRRGERGASSARRRAAAGRRRFAVLVVVPVLLMLGSVYLHTVAAGLSGEVAGLEERLSRAEAEGERLEVRVAELSKAARIRPLAAEKLGMGDPGASELEAYNGNGSNSEGKHREDGRQNGGEQRGGTSR